MVLQHLVSMWEYMKLDLWSHTHTNDSNLIVTLILKDKTKVVKGKEKRVPS